MSKRTCYYHQGTLIEASCEKCSKMICHKCGKKYLEKKIGRNEEGKLKILQNEYLLCPKCYCDKTIKKINAHNYRLVIFGIFLWIGAIWLLFNIPTTNTNSKLSFNLIVVPMLIFTYFIYWDITQRGRKEKIKVRYTLVKFQRNR